MAKMMDSAHANLVKGMIGNKHLSAGNPYSFDKLTRQQGQLWHLGIWSLSQLALWCSLLIGSSEMASILDNLYLHIGLELWIIYTGKAGVVSFRASH